MANPFVFNVLQRNMTSDTFHEQAVPILHAIRSPSRDFYQYIVKSITQKSQAEGQIHVRNGNLEKKIISKVFKRWSTSNVSEQKPSLSPS